MSEAKTEKPRVPAVEGWFTMSDPPTLTGTRCTACKTVFFPRETVAIYRLASHGRYEEAREIYRWFMPLLHLDVSHRFVQNIKVVEEMVRGTSPVVRAPRLALDGEELERVRQIVVAALETQPDLARYGL